MDLHERHEIQVAAGGQHGSTAVGAAALITWITVWGVAAGLLLVATVNADRASERGDPSPFAEGTGAADLGSLKVILQSVETSPIETVVVAVFAGRESDGDTIELIGRSQLLVSDGTLLEARRGSAEGRKVTLWLDPIPAGASIEQLILNGVAIAKTAAPAGRTVGEDRRVTPIGSFKIRPHEKDVVPVPSESVEMIEKVPIGPGELVITTIVTTGTQLAILGHFEGISEEQFVLTPLDTPRLTFAGGRSAEWAFTKVGSDSDPSVFEIRFTVESRCPWRSSTRNGLPEQLEGLPHPPVAGTGLGAAEREHCGEGVACVTGSGRPSGGVCSGRSLGPLATACLQSRSTSPSLRDLRSLP